MNRVSFLITICLIFMTSLSNAEIQVSGIVSGTWSKVNSPYIVIGDISIQEDSTLNIEPGVEVQFKGQYELQVKGELHAIGTENDSINFTHYYDNPDSTWNGIRIIGSEISCSFEYCKFEYARNPNTERGAIYSTDAELTISNCLFKNNNAEDDGGAIYSYNCSIMIKSSYFIDNTAYSEGGAIYCSGGKYLKLINCIFKNNSAHDGGAISNFTNMYISGCKFYNNYSTNTGGAIACINYSILNSIFKDNNSSSGDALWLRSDGQIINSIIYDKNKQSRTVGIWFEYKVTFRNCILRNMTFYNQYGNFVDLKLEYCNVDGGWEGEGNIDADPLFVDPDNGDFHLRQISPCINSGHPSAFYADYDGTRNDMGIYGGTGLAINVEDIDFGPAGIGQTKIYDWVLYNFRETSFTIDNWTFSDNLNFSTDGQYPLTLQSMSWDTLGLKFHPTSSGNLSCQLLIESRDFVLSNTAPIFLHGLGNIFAGEVSGIWSKENSPYIIGGNIIIPENETLIIEPGVEVRIDTNFSANIEIRVEGSLHAIGAESDSIIFSVLAGQEVKGAWKGINFDPPYDQNFSVSGERDNIEKEMGIDPATEKDINEYKSILSSRSHSNSSLMLVSELKLHYCRISYAETGIVAETSEADIQNCKISNNLTYGVKWQGIERRASGTLLNCVISNNDAFGVFCYSECFDEYAHASPEINSNKIMHNGKGGIYLYADGGRPSSWTWPGGTWDECYVSPQIISNIISNNDGPAIECKSYGAIATGYFSTHKSAAYTEPTIKQNIMFLNQSGIYTKSHLFDDEYTLSFSDISLDKNTFYDNQGIQLHASDSTSFISAVNSIFWNYNSESIAMEEDAEIIVNYCNLEYEVEGSGNISLDPAFVDAMNGNFNLTYFSPCIDAGHPDSAKDADGTRTDIGVFYYHQSISPFSLHFPQNDTTIATLTPEFVWNAALTTGGDPLTYDLYYSTVNSFHDSATVIISDVENNRYVLTDSLEDRQTYYWKVLAKNLWSMQKWSSETMSFAVDTDTVPPYFTQDLPELSFNEDDSLILSITYWYDFVEDEKCVDSTLSLDIKSGKRVTVIKDDTSLTFLARQNWFGNDTLQLIVKDLSQLQNQSNFYVHVLPINDPPMITSADNVHAFEDEKFFYRATAKDIDDPVLDYNFINYPKWLIADADSIFGIPLEGTQDSSFTLIVNDGELFDTLKVFIDVKNVNDPPVFSTIPDTSFNEDSILLFKYSYFTKFFEDPDSPDSTLVFSIPNSENIFISISPDSVSFASSPNWFGSSKLTAIISDGEYNDSTSFEITVKPINDAPTITGLPDSVYFRNDTSAVINLWDFIDDVETNDSLLIYTFQLTYNWVIKMDSIVFAYNNRNGNVNLSATSQFIGEASLLVTVGDDSNASVQQSIKINVDGPQGLSFFNEQKPEDYKLYQNYPNPFNPKTTIPISLPEESEISLNIYNLNGKLVATVFNGKKSAGNHMIDWDAINYSSGTYFIRLKTEKYEKTLKCILLK